MSDTERLDYILRRLTADFRFDIHSILGDYEGDDEEEYFATARQAIDDAAVLDVEFIQSGAPQ